MHGSGVSDKNVTEIVTQATPVPIIVNELKIAGLGARGEGFAYVGGDRVYIPATLPGETVLAEIVGKRGFATEIIEPSPDRVTPFCPHFGACGGCQLQHMTVAAYRAFKRDLLVQACERAGLEGDIGALADMSGAGRRRVTMHAKDGQAGFNALRSHHLHPLDKCPILVPALANAPQIAAGLSRLLGPCDVSLTATATGLDVRAVPGTRHPVKPAAIVRLGDFAGKHGLARLSLKGETVFMSRQPQIRMGSATVSLPPASFLQATAEAEDYMTGFAVAALAGARRVVDLFCGVGPFALRLAETAKTMAVDSDGAAVAACRDALAGTPGLKSLGAETRDLFRDPLSAAELKSFDAAIVDPPRAGAEAQMLELAASGVPTIVSVSCDPASFARDGMILQQAGYRAGPVVPVDQFAWSAHLETIAVFRRAK